jgi:fructosamine-3-kinase
MALPAGARDVRRVGGGDINDAFHVTLGDGREAFVKTRADAAAGEYAAEAAGLEWLAEPGALRTPRVLDVDVRYLALEWVVRGVPGGLDVTGAEELGRGLAATHMAGAPCTRCCSAVLTLRRPSAPLAATSADCVWR